MRKLGRFLREWTAADWLAAIALYLSFSFIGGWLDGSIELKAPKLQNAHLAALVAAHRDFRR